VFGAAQVIYTAAPVFLPGSFDPLTTRIDIIPGDEQVIVPAPARLKPPKLRREPVDRNDKDDIDRLVHFVATAAAGNRNAALYWAARRVAEQNGVDAQTAKLLEDAAVRAGLSAVEAAATIRSGGRHHE